jgi:quinol monooxygenase YgiN
MELKAFKFLRFALVLSSFNNPLLAQRVTLLVTLHVKPEQKEAFKAILLQDKQESLKEPGNISFTIFQHRDKPDTFYLLERWASQQVLDVHFKKPYTQQAFELAKTALLTPMEMLKLNDIDPLPKAQIKMPLATDSPVDLICIFKIKPGMSPLFIDQFRKSIANSRPEPGNISFFFHTVPGDTTTYVLAERWRSETALQSHFQEPYTKELFAMFAHALPQPAENYLNYVTEIK